MAPSVVLEYLITILIILPGCVLKLTQVAKPALAQNDHLKPKLSISCRFAMKREQQLTPIFNLCFLPPVAKTIYIYIKDKKSRTLE